MKYKYILASALSLAVVGASIISPFSYAVDIDLIQIADNYYNYLQDIVTGTLGQTYANILSEYHTVGQLGLVDGTDYIFVITNIEYLTSGTHAPAYRYTLGFGSVVRNPGSSWSVYNTTMFTYAKDGYIRRGTTWYNPSTYNYIDLPTNWYDSSGQEHTIDLQFTTAKQTTPTRFNGTLQDNLNSIIYQYNPPSTSPPNTTPAPGFPNLPNEWVNGNGNTYNIDLPDFDFNIDLPSYTMPEAVSIPADIVQKSSALYQIPLNIIDRYGLWWLVGLALICTVITLILNR